MTHPQVYTQLKEEEKKDSKEWLCPVLPLDKREYQGSLCPSFSSTSGATISLSSTTHHVMIIVIVVVFSLSPFLALEWLESLPFCMTQPHGLSSSFSFLLNSFDKETDIERIMVYCGILWYIMVYHVWYFTRENSSLLMWRWCGCLTIPLKGNIEENTKLHTKRPFDDRSNRLPLQAETTDTLSNQMNHDIEWHPNVTSTQQGTQNEQTDLKTIVEMRKEWLKIY